jgi:hypothetical protein
MPVFECGLQAGQSMAGMHNLLEQCRFTSESAPK